MSWFKQRIIARVQALMPSDWAGEPGERFRDGSVEKLEDGYADTSVTEQPSRSEVERQNLKEIPDHAYNAAIREFAEREERKIREELERRRLESDVRLKEADVKLREAQALKVQAELMDFLRSKGLSLYRDEHGNFAIVPSTSNVTGKRKPASAE